MTKIITKPKHGVNNLTGVCKSVPVTGAGEEISAYIYCPPNSIKASSILELTAVFRVFSTVGGSGRPLFYHNTINSVTGSNALYLGVSYMNQSNYHLPVHRSMVVNDGKLTTQLGSMAYVDYRNMLTTSMSMYDFNVAGPNYFIMAAVKNAAGLTKMQVTHYRLLNYF